MSSPRYTLLLANRNTGAVRRFTFVRRPLVLGVIGLFTVPTLVGLGARWSGQAEIDSLRTANEGLRAENENYRSATGDADFVSAGGHRRSQPAERTRSGDPSSA